MASITRQLGGGDNGLVHAEFYYDDVSLVVTGAKAYNDDSGPHTVLIDVENPSTLAIVWTRTITLAGHGTMTWDVSALNLLMVDHVGKGGVHYLLPPYFIALGVS